MMIKRALRLVLLVTVLYLQLYTAEGNINANDGLRYGRKLDDTDQITAWKSWLGSVVTENAVVFPENDSELQAILNAAKQDGKKIRITGSGHSEDGIVIEATEPNVLVVSLYKYKPESSWDMVLDTESNEPSVKISAGAGLFDLMAFIRPKGYLLKTMPAGAIFSIGGVMANSVHGGTHTESFLYEYLVGIRVMLHNGTIKEITDEADLKHWRGSFGLLGVITACQISIRKENADKGILMTTAETKIEHWNEEAVKKTLLSYRDAYDASEIYFNPLDDSVLALLLNYDSNENFKFQNAQDTTVNYDAIKAGPWGKTSLLGAPLSTDPFASIFLDQSQEWKLLAQLQLSLGLQVPKETYNSASNLVNDGFSLQYGGPIFLFNQIHRFIRLENLFDALDALREIYREYNDPLFGQSSYYFSGPVEFRFLTVREGISTLTPLPPGDYVSIEIVCPRNPGDMDLAYAEAFKRVEDALTQFSAGIHFGKSWGYSKPDPELPPFPFQDEQVINSALSTEQKNTFLQQMNSYDPDGLFSAGGALRWFKPDEAEPFEYKRLDGESCKVYGEKICKSGCCYLGKCGLGWLAPCSTSEGSCPCPGALSCNYGIFSRKYKCTHTRFF